VRSRVAGATVAAALGALAVVVAACGGGSAVAAPVAPSLSLGGLRIVSSLTLKHGTADVVVPGGAVVSFDVKLGPRSILDVGAGSQLVRLTRTSAAPPGWLGRDEWRHVELADGRVAVDGRVTSTEWPTAAGALRFRIARGSVAINALIVSPGADPAALLFHRLAELHARVPAGQFPMGSTVGDRIYYDASWTSGFYAGALWQAAALEPAGGMFARWATAATIDHFGSERAPTHDVGFMYGESSLNGWRALCGRGEQGSTALCARLKQSVVSAADELLALAATNPGSGTIPTNPTSPEGETIVDSMMNIAILPWASGATGNVVYSRLARHQARVIASVLVRRNGSTAQSANFDRATGRLLSVTTHQGLSNSSTWSRGEGWALYGFAVAASELNDRAFLRVAERVAGYVAAHLPAGGVPRWDYDAPAGAPVDVSGGAITAAGLLHLVAACRQLGGAGCGVAAVSGWSALARRMLAAALGYASPRPPLGLLRSQIEDEHFHGCWCNSGELIYGVTYALEALALTRRS
jgi:unsaturated chondroitin disaccharide hydrolase